MLDLHFRLSFINATQKRGLVSVLLVVFGLHVSKATETEQILTNEIVKTIHGTQVLSNIQHAVSKMLSDGSSSSAYC